MPMLFDIATPWRWLDGSPRSLDNGFTLGFTGAPVDWRALAVTERAKQVAIERNAQLRARGVDQSVMALKLRRRKEKAA